jgi:transposase
MNNKHYISVGIDVGSCFSWMSIVTPDGKPISKPFKITHNDPESLEKAVSAIQKAEELHSLESRTFLESTGIYHFPLFCYLVDHGFSTYIINPIITHSVKNASIRKVKNDKIDSLGIARLGLTPELPVSNFPAKLVLELRSLTRKYFDITDQRSAYVNKLKGDLKTVFPQYQDIFCNITGKTSVMILRQYPTPEKILRGHKKTMIEKISKSSRRGIVRAEQYYDKLCAAASMATTFGCPIESIYFNISLSLDFIEQFDAALASIMKRIELLITLNIKDRFIQQIRLLQTIKGVGFLTAVTIMCEIGDFAAFKSPKQLFAYFGLDPEVKQSGNFIATNVHMSKRGSRIARRAIFTIALASIRTTRSGVAINPHLHAYYTLKSGQKPKMVALGAVMHKVCNIIFAVLRDEKPFQLRSPDEHRSQHQRSLPLAA